MKNPPQHVDDVPVDLVLVVMVPGSSLLSVPVFERVTFNVSNTVM